MSRRFFIWSMLCCFIITCFCGTSLVIAQGSEDPETTVTSIPQKQKIYGIVGQIKYVDLKKQGKTVIAVENKKGQEVEVHFEDMKRGSTILLTYRKEKDKTTGKEKNVFISMSVIKGADYAAGKK